MHIQTNNLTYHYPGSRPQDRRALDHVSVAIEKASWTALIGPTGSGKTTFALHLNGLLKPTSGQVLINGKDVHAKGFSSLKLKRTVGLVFQYPEHQIFEATVYDEVAYGPRNLGLPEQEVDQAIKGAMASVGLDFDFFKSRNPLELSGGEKRKVAVAGVLAMNPEVLVFDEATAGLDPAGRKRLLKEVARLQTSLGITIVWVTHNLTEVLEYADKVIVFHQGHVAADGTPAEVFSQVKLLEEINLGIPQLIELEHKLRGRGFVPKKSFVSLSTAAEAITSFLRREIP